MGSNHSRKEDVLMHAPTNAAGWTHVQSAVTVSHLRIFYWIVDIAAEIRGILVLTIWCHRIRRLLVRLAALAIMLCASEFQTIASFVKLRCSFVILVSLGVSPPRSVVYKMSATNMIVIILKVSVLHWRHWAPEDYCQAAELMDVQ
eukprot:2981743-Amphidinium_carterae.2